MTTAKLERVVAADEAANVIDLRSYQPAESLGHEPS